MSQANIDAVRSIYAGFGSGDVEAILANVADQVDWKAGAERTDRWYGTRTNHAEVADFFAQIAAAGQVTEFSVEALGANDDGEVFALLRFGFTATETGRSASMALHHYWRFDDDGKVVTYRGAEDTAAMAAALGG